MEKQHVKIKLSAVGDGFVEIDGERLGGVTKVQILGRVGEMPRVLIELLSADVEFEAEAEVEVLESAQ